MTITTLMLALFALDVDPGPITNVSWAQHPTPDYPAAAMAQGLKSGSAQLNCGVRAAGGLSDCRIVSETPAGAGFGAAAVSAARKARVSDTVTAEATSEDARIQFTIRFQAN